MTSCPSCGRERAGAFRYCLSCGYDYDAGVGPPAPSDPTATPTDQSEASSGAPEPPAQEPPAAVAMVIPSAVPPPEPVAAPPPEPIAAPPPEPIAAPPLAPVAPPASSAPAPPSEPMDRPPREPTAATTAPPAATTAPPAAATAPPAAATAPPAAAESATVASPTTPGPRIPAERRRTVAILAGATALLAAFALGIVVSGMIRGIDTASVADPSAGPATSLGITADEVTTVHALEQFGAFTFQDAPLADGRPRIVGESSNHRSRLELVGPRTDLTELSLRVPAAVATTELPRFAAMWFPDSTQFVTDVAKAATGATVRQTFGTVEVSVRVDSDGDATVTFAGRA